MKSKFKTILALALGCACAMTAGMFAACGKDDDDGGNKGGVDVGDIQQGIDDEKEKNKLTYVSDYTVTAGTYYYFEIKEATSAASIPWTLVLKDDHSFTLTEKNSLKGTTDNYAGGVWVSEGNKVTLGVFNTDGRPIEYDWCFPWGTNLYIATGEDQVDEDTGYRLFQPVFMVESESTYRNYYLYNWEVEEANVKYIYTIAYKSTDCFLIETKYTLSSGTVTAIEVNDYDFALQTAENGSINVTLSGDKTAVGTKITLPAFEGSAPATLSSYANGFVATIAAFNSEYQTGTVTVGAVEAE
ncbi:MAG: hypothetical protein J1E36_06810 [Eubacterium sp.]|nr:hypothetical protein [Eubacterium sp.]